MDIHRSPKRMVTGEPWAASTCSQIASCSASRQPLPRTRCPPQIAKVDVGATEVSIPKPGRPKNVRRQRDSGRPSTHWEESEARRSVGEGMQGVHGPVHQENVQAASGIGCGGSPSSGEPCASGEVGGTASSNTSRLWPTLAKPSLAKRTLAQTKFGQMRFGQNQVWPNELWPGPTLARPTGLCTCCAPNCGIVCPNRPHPPRPGPTALPRNAQNFAFFCPSPSAPAASGRRGRRGFTRQPENSKRAHLRVPEFTTKLQREEPQERKKELKLWREREEEVRNFGPSTLRGPPFGLTPTPSQAPHLTGRPKPPDVEKKKNGAKLGAGQT